MPRPDLEEDPDAHDDDHAGEGSIKEVIVTIVAALALAWFVQGYLVKPFRIPSGSMENTLRCGDRVLVNRFGYHFGKPHRGDVVVFHPPAGIDERGRPDRDVIAGEGATPPRRKNGERDVIRANVNYIKRIVGTPGDRIEVRGHHAYINGKKLDEPYLHPLPKDASISSESEFQEITVPKNMYFMMGDHRDNSADSRVFGVVPREFIIGKAFMEYWPPQRIGGLPDRDPGGAASRKPDPRCLESAGASGG